MARRPKPISPPPISPPPYPMVFETLSEPFINKHDMEKEPSCSNGIVNVRRYRITVELIDEPIEVIRERILKLWYACDNWHHWSPLKSAAARVGLVLDMRDVGRDRKEKVPRMPHS